MNIGRKLWNPSAPLVLMLAMNCAAVAAEKPTRFSPASGVKAELVVAASQVTLSVTSPRGRVEDVFVLETENPLRITVDDYNFDGHSDFSVSHTDDGKGTYRIFDIHLYVPSQGKFERLSPACGDEFIEVQLDKEKHELINTYMEDFRYATCSMKF